MDRFLKFFVLAVMIILAKALWYLVPKICRVLFSKEFWRKWRMRIESMGEVNDSMPQVFKWFIPCVFAIAMSIGIRFLVEEVNDDYLDDDYMGWIMVGAAVAVFLLGKRYLRSFWLRLALCLSVVMSIMGWMEIFERW